MKTNQTNKEVSAVKVSAVIEWIDNATDLQLNAIILLAKLQLEEKQSKKVKP